MTKTYIPCALAALALAACSQMDEAAAPAPGQPQAIQFEPYVHTTQTRAAGIDNTNINSQTLRVWGFCGDSSGDTESVFASGANPDDPAYRSLSPSTAVAMLRNTGGWTIDKPALWKKNKDYTFLATNWAHITEGGLGEESPAPAITDFPLCAPATEENDILVANSWALTDDGDEPAEPVQLELSHLYSRLSFHPFVNGETDQDVTLKEITLYVPQAEPKYDFRDGKVLYVNYEDIVIDDAGATIISENKSSSWPGPMYETGGESIPTNYEPFTVFDASLTLPVHESLDPAEPAEEDNFNFDINFDDGETSGDTEDVSFEGLDIDPVGDVFLAPGEETMIFLTLKYEYKGVPISYKGKLVSNLPSLVGGTHYKLFIEIEKPNEPVKFGLQQSLTGWGDFDE